MATISPVQSPLAGYNLADLFLGKTTTTSNSGGTQTTQEQVSTDKANAYIKQMLEGTSGLASTVSGQKTAGMYNSTVNQQLVDDLLARTASGAASLSKTTTQTVSPTSATTRVAPQVGNNGLGGLVGLQLAPQELKDKLKTALGLSKAASTGTGVNTAQQTFRGAEIAAENNAPAAAATSVDGSLMASGSEGAIASPVTSSSVIGTDLAPVTAELVPAATELMPAATELVPAAVDAGITSAGIDAAGDVLASTTTAAVVDTAIEATAATATDAALGDFLLSLFLF